MTLELEMDLELTAREAEVLRLVGEGLSNREVGVRLSLSPATIRTHLEHIYDKLDVCNRVQAVVKGIKDGLLDVNVLA